MKTAFYNRTAYLSDPLTVPPCLLRLDEYYEGEVPDIVTGWQRFYALHAENVCRRMGVIDLYAWLIGDVNGHPNPIWAATLIGSYFVGLFSTCKSLFDAGAICLTELHSLRLASKEQDMAKGLGRPEGSRELSPGLRPPGRCPGSTGTTAMRPEGPREPGRTEPTPEELWRPFRPHQLVAFLPRASAWGPKPWAGFCRPVGPGGAATSRSAALTQFCPGTVRTKGLRAKRAKFLPPDGQLRFPRGEASSVRLV